MDYDHSKYVAFELSLEEIQFLRDLLKFEILFQITRNIRDYNQNNLEEVATRTFTGFDIYRMYDDILADIYSIIVANQADDLKEGIKSQNLILVSKKAALLYKAICKDTPKLELTVELRQQSDKLAQNIINRIDFALSEHESAFSNNPDDIQVNILGIQGLA